MPFGSKSASCKCNAGSINKVKNNINNLYVTTKLQACMCSNFLSTQASIRHINTKPF